MLAASAVMLFNIAIGSNTADKSRLVRTVSAFFTRPAVPTVAQVADRREQPVAEVVDRREAASSVTEVVGRREQPVAEVVATRAACRRGRRATRAACRRGRRATRAACRRGSRATRAACRRGGRATRAADTETKPKKVTAKQKPKPKFAERRPYYSYPWGGGDPIIIGSVKAALNASTAPLLPRHTLGGTPRMAKN